MAIKKELCQHCRILAHSQGMLAADPWGGLLGVGHSRVLTRFAFGSLGVSE